MTTRTDDPLRDRWRAFFSTVLPPQPELIEAATTATMAAIATGAGQDAAVVAGMAAARGVTGDRAATARASTAPSRPAPSSVADPMTSTRTWPRGSAVVHSLERRSESLDGVFFQVLSLRLLRLQDGRTPVGPHVPVELRGRSIVGPISRGDVVLTPPGREGHTRVVKTLTNLTTESAVEAKGRPFRKVRTVTRSIRLAVRVATGLLALLVLAGVALVGYLLVSGSSPSVPGM